VRALARIGYAVDGVEECFDGLVLRCKDVRGVHRVAPPLVS
jgi:hypothetical protein